MSSPLVRGIVIGVVATFAAIHYATPETIDLIREWIINNWIDILLVLTAGYTGYQEFRHNYKFGTLRHKPKTEKPGQDAAANK